MVRNCPPIPRTAMLLACGIFLSGCHTTHHFGDARIRNNWDFPFVAYDRFFTKPIPLDHAATNILHVRNLPLPVFPTHLVVPITPAEAELKQAFPWEEARMKIEFRTPSGEHFYSREIALREASLGRSSETAHELALQFRPGRPQRNPNEELPAYTNYDIVVTVLAPSRNPNHRVKLYADTHWK